MTLISKTWESGAQRVKAFSECTGVRAGLRHPFFTAGYFHIWANPSQAPSRSTSSSAAKWKKAGSRLPRFNH